MLSENEENKLSKEARLFSIYLIGELPSEEEIGLYLKAHTLTNYELTKVELAALSLSMKHPFLISIFDSGFSLLRPRGNYKKKLFVMMAILEASVFHYSKFFPKLKGNNILLILFYGCRAVLRALVGFLLVKLLITRHGKV